MTSLLSFRGHSTYNPETGLWKRCHPGHTAATAHCEFSHAGPDTASLLLVGAQLGMLNELPVSRILEGLEALQNIDEGERNGCFRWYAEDPEVIDTNAAFFVGLNLIVLHRAFADQLAPDDLNRLERMLGRLLLWFKIEVHSRLRHYPNKFLGDLTCVWLLHEILDEPTAWLETEMIASARYYLDSPWGWGEHLSDPYSTIMLDEISCLLLLAKTLPDAIRRCFRELLVDLLSIEDFFEGGPRVPTIRTYAFQEVSPHRNYRESVSQWENFDEFLHNAAELTHILKFNFGHLFQQLGWHQLAPKKPDLVLPRVREIRCFNNHHATAWVTSEFRLGSISSYPVMPNCDHPKWGLSWQTMPLAFLVGPDQWGFWRWSASEDGVVRAHPALDKAQAYLHNALSDAVSPPIVGETVAWQHEQAILALRRMPSRSHRWEWLADGLSLVRFRGDASCEGLAAGWHRLRLEFEEGPVLNVWFHPLNTGLVPQLRQKHHQLQWEVRWIPTATSLLSKFNVLWAMSFSDDVRPPELTQLADPLEIPRVEAHGDNSWRVSWKELSHRHFVIDPVSTNPLAAQVGPQD